MADDKQDNGNDKKAAGKPSKVALSDAERVAYDHETQEGSK